MHREVTSPSPSSRNFFPHAESFRQTPEGHCYCRSSEIQRYSFSEHCRFLQSPLSISPVPRWRLAPCSLLLIPAPHDRLDTCGRRRRAGRGAPPREWQQQLPLRLPERRSVGRCRPVPPKPPEATAWPSTHLCTLQGHRRELEGAPCRRRARTAVPSRASVLRKPDRGLSREMVPVIHHDDA